MSPAPTRAILRINAALAADARGLQSASGGLSVLVEYQPTLAQRFPHRILAVGSPEQVSAHEAARAPGLRIINRPNALLLPGMVNAHTHLDLTHIGPQPHDPADGFDPWLRMIRENRLSDAALIKASVSKGAELSLKAGVVAVGDIAGAVKGRASLAATEALKATPLSGISFIEFFALGAREQIALTWLDQAIEEARRRKWLDNPDERIQVGIQPHAPYSVSPNAYLAVAHGLNLRSCTHLAESLDERQFLTTGKGPLRDMLEKLGIWTPEADQAIGRALSSVQHAQTNALKRVSLVAHVNDASDADLDTLAQSGVSVAYCPRASAYFGAERHFGPHRYREMLRKGMCVALGTDSIVNLPSEAATRGISIWDEMRFLHTRDGTDPLTLLQMGTTNAAVALGFPPEPFTIRASLHIAGLVAVPITGPSDDPLAAAMRSADVPELLFHSNVSDTAR